MMAPSSAPSARLWWKTKTAMRATTAAEISTPTVARSAAGASTARTILHGVSRPPENRIRIRQTTPTSFETA